MRIAAADAPWSDGRCSLTGGDSILLGQSGLEHRFSVAGVDTLWVRQSNTLRAAWVGGALGAAVLTTLAVLVNTSDLCDQTNCSYASGIAVGVLVGGGGGALLGATFGALSRRWVRRFPD